MEKRKPSYDLNAVMISPETGKKLVRDVRPFPVTYKGETIVVDMPGYYPEDGGDDDDGVLIGDNMTAASDALRELKRRIDGLPSPDEIRSLRAKLKLSQREAGALFKVGENAFDKYERGVIDPSGPTIQLMKLFDKHPELIEELRARAA